MRRLIIGGLAAVAAALGIAAAAPAQAHADEPGVGRLTVLFPASTGCGSGNSYDPSHEICQPYAPASPPPGYFDPGYGTSCNRYDALHEICY